MSVLIDIIASSCFFDSRGRFRDTIIRCLGQMLLTMSLVGDRKKSGVDTGFRNRGYG